MVQIVFVTPDGARRTVPAPAGRSLMEAAVMNNVPGILAECGGGCSCGTCHVYVEEARLNELPEPSPMENAMLDCLAEAGANSRLACQVKLLPSYDGLVVKLPSRHG